jgi:hypothetical protein
VLLAVGVWRGLRNVPLEEFPGAPFWGPELAAIRAEVQPGDALYAAGYDSVGVFLNFRKWRWVRRERFAPRHDRFTVKRCDEHLTVIRDRRWEIPLPPTPIFVAEVAAVLRATGAGAMWVVALPQGPFDRTNATVDAERDLARLATAAGLRLDRRLVFDSGLAFRVAPVVGPQIARAPAAGG